ncbi:hypothetical protein F5Y10DRAFT_276360 [Nemania abortiva]|nr:hypothetical protein F5Y10DRAFT_276360 [Nemania abortiva]
MDISQSGRVNLTLQQWIETAKRADPQWEQVLRDGLNPQLVDAGNDDLARRAKFPQAYLPSIRPVDELLSMPISQMEFDKIHRGKKAILRVITPQDTVVAITAVAEDEEGSAVLLQLYCQQSLTVADPEDLLHPNMILIIKEPFFEIVGDGMFGIRVDHVSDVVWLQNADPRIPSKWKYQGSETETARAILMRGTAAGKNEQWVKAENLCSHALRVAETPKAEEIALLNRSLANLRLWRSEKALGDALAAIKIGKLYKQGLFREARALYQLERFTESVEKWHMFIKLHPQNTAAQKALEKCEERVKELRTGEYDFGSMYEQARRTPPIIDCATYKGPVVVREAPGRGNGLFTTQPVKAGDLLFCEKAFAYCFAGNDHSIGRRNMGTTLHLDINEVRRGGRAHLLTDIVQKLYHSPQAAKAFRTLCHGDYTSVTITEIEGQPVVDTFFVDQVISLNCSYSPRTDHGIRVFKNMIERDVATCGIWVLASRINHSCLGNCRRSFIGDMQIVRACQDLAAGTELLSSYHSLAFTGTYEETQEILSNWEFVCDCSWCLDRKSTTKEMLQKRLNLLKDIPAAMLEAIEGKPMQLAEMPKLLERAESTYIKSEGAVRPELLVGYFTLAKTHITLNRPRDGAEAAIKGLEALGYDIVACPPQNGEEKLEIRRWGYFEDVGVVAFTQLHAAYKIIAPELCAKAKQYARILYSIRTGTDTTFDDVFPELV